MNRRSPAAASLLAFGIASLTLNAIAASPTGPVTLATTPLANSSTTVVKPNIMFTMDNSGSMDWDYLPDWANTSNKKLDRNAAYNGVAYNPAIVYTKPVFYAADGALDTSTYPDQTGQSTATGSNTVDDKPNWKSVKNDAYGVQSTGRSDLTYNANYYTFIAGEYCTTPTLETCTAADAPSTTHPYPASLRWCSDSGLSNCRALRNGDTYNRARYPGMGNIRATITVRSGTSNRAASSIIVDGHQILNAATAPSTSRNTVAIRIRDAINECTNSIPTNSNCTIYGYSATSNDEVVTITSPYSGYPQTPVVTMTVGGVPTANLVTVTAFSAATTLGKIFYTPILPSNNAYNYPGTNAKHPSRTDCLGSSCTYTEEMTNYANWYTYYRTRMQAMKTSVSRAFKVLDQGYRVGYNTIGYEGSSNSNNNFLNPNTFELAHKNTWYTKMFSTGTPVYTPLRAAVAKIGRFYANKLTGQTDPIQYSCQQNFHILSTDGYWNTNDETSSYGPYKISSNSEVDDMDGDAPLPYKDSSGAENTLADVAMYYYQTDLRTPSLNNCTGATLPNGTTNNVCPDNVFVSDSDTNTKQHVTQFTMGMGIDGTLNFQTDYATATSGDYYELKRGLNNKSWPNPITNTSEARIDDLWHAAVNGRGTYFSAKDPDSIVRGFTSALTAIKSKVGAGAAAATSTLNPVAGDNFAYVASYTTVKWQGNLEARTIDTLTGIVSENANWCAENVLSSTCTAPGTIEETSTTSGIVYNCVTPSVAAATCTSLGGTSLVNGSCAVPIATSCTGTMIGKVAPTSDTRTILMANVAGNALIDFNYTNIVARGLDNKFAEAYLDGKLSQWNDYTAGQKIEAQGENLIKFLRGQTGFEDRSINASAGRSTLYRFRSTTLGDITESQPVFVGKPIFNYTDAGYKEFVTAKTNRAKTIFVGANDGMLHAFDAATGQERWAFVPTAVIPNLWVLADKLYSGKHTNFVNGEPVIGDIFDPSASSDCSLPTPTNPSNCWKTILVAGLNGGGRSYYALDITDPTTPILLWELNSDTVPNLGYSYGPPVITKNSAGTWTVLLTSGYNNTSPGDGGGHLFVRDAKTGAAIKTVSTGVGSLSIPSGFAKVSNYADQGNVNNTSQYVYGGDLMGNVWRIDINAATSTAVKFAVLKATGGATQPITAAPELGVYGNKRMVFIGTGKYLEDSDLSDSQEQTIYGITDNNETVTFDNPRISPLMVEQFLSTVTDGRTSTRNPVDIFTHRGWFIDFPDSGERVHVNPKLDAGALFVPSTVPSNTACSPGGYGWFNYFDYRNGWPLADAQGGLVSQRTNAPIVGFNIFYLPSGQRVIGIVTADGPTPRKPAKDTGDPRAGNKFGGLRIMWREILTP